MLICAARRVQPSALLQLEHGVSKCEQGALGWVHSSRSHNEFHVKKARGKPKVQPKALTDDCRWVKVAFVRVAVYLKARYKLDFCR
jgi:hypothetical protein